jgi:hypothetical protein
MRVLAERRAAQPPDISSPASSSTSKSSALDRLQQPTVEVGQRVCALRDHPYSAAPMTYDLRRRRTQRG